MSEWLEDEHRPFGWFQPAEGELYASTVKQHPGGVVVELGTYLGRSLSYILPTCKELGIKVYAVDRWNWMKSDNPNLTCPPCSLALLHANLNRLGATGQVTILQTDSIEAAANFSDESVDVVMIDTEHTKEQTTHEIDTWWPKLKKSGDILFHDYAVNVPRWGVQKAVDERFGKPDEVRLGLAHVKKR